MSKANQKGGQVISSAIRITGYSSILFVLLILFFLLREGLPALASTPLKSLFSVRWYPIEGYFGILPLILGSLLVTIAATLIALPFGIGSAVFLSEVAPPWLCDIRKPIIEILVGIP